ncbi:hypothetical protein CCACVL1_03507 [Corchorus capsularis]|uniref:Uncharacterized protein n=1 Tax=Corchorus capsularis TaxID=210143 RepID=A0A1R3JYU9_COCAP|nr:hypothetical protein CCACVL1_03507 [Corchorus capsularis]
MANDVVLKVKEEVKGSLKQDSFVPQGGHHQK